MLVSDSVGVWGRAWRAMCSPADRFGSAVGVPVQLIDDVCHSRGLLNMCDGAAGRSLLSVGCAWA